MDVRSKIIKMLKALARVLKTLLKANAILRKHWKSKKEVEPEATGVQDESEASTT